MSVLMRVLLLGSQLLLSLSFLLLGGLALFLVNQVVHRHYRLLAVRLSRLRVLALILSAHGLTSHRRVPSALLIVCVRGRLTLLCGCRCVHLLRWLGCPAAVLSRGALVLLSTCLFRLVRGPHVDHLDFLTDVELGLDHHGVVALLEDNVLHGAASFRLALGAAVLLGVRLLLRLLVLWLLRVF